MDIGCVKIKWLGHAGFLLNNSKIVYIDPFQLKTDLPVADLILITHGHYDHCSLEDIQKIVGPKTLILAPSDCSSKLVRGEVPLNVSIIEPGQEIKVSDRIRVDIFPAYNLDKPFHTKDSGGVGYLIKFEDVLIYHAGDTDTIPEMQRLTGYQGSGKNLVALLPIGGRFTMCSEEAFEAVKIIKPTFTIPMHYGSIAGTSEDAREFASLCEAEGYSVRILERE